MTFPAKPFQKPASHPDTVSTAILTQKMLTEKPPMAKISKFLWIFFPSVYWRENLGENRPVTKKVLWGVFQWSVQELVTNFTRKKIERSFYVAEEEAY